MRSCVLFLVCIGAATLGSILLLYRGYTECVLMAACMYITMQVSGYVQYMSSECKDVSCVCYLFTNSNNNKGVMVVILLHLY